MAVTMPGHFKAQMLASAGFDGAIVEFVNPDGSTHSESLALVVSADGVARSENTKAPITLDSSATYRITSKADGLIASGTVGELVGLPLGTTGYTVAIKDVVANLFA